LHMCRGYNRIKGSTFDKQTRLLKSMPESATSPGASMDSVRPDLFGLDCRLLNSSPAISTSGQLVEACSTGCGGVASLEQPHRPGWSTSIGSMWSRDGSRSALKRQPALPYRAASGRSWKKQMLQRLNFPQHRWPSLAADLVMSRKFRSLSASSSSSLAFGTIFRTASQPYAATST